MSRSMTGEGLWLVVRNPESRYSVWPVALPLPDGWQAAGHAASRTDCLDWIDANWTDPRPAALQAAMDQAIGDAG